MRMEMPDSENKHLNSPKNSNAPTFLMEEETTWGSLTGRQRARYLFDYYKLPFLLALILLYICGFLIHREVTRKDTLLYTGLVNISPTETTIQQLTGDFLGYRNSDSKKQELQLYTGWYLTTDKDSQYYEYTYASQIKILAAIDDEQLDVVLLDRESFDAFSQNGYLYNLEELLSETELYDRLKPYFVTNVEFLEDNAKEINFDASVAFESVNVEYPMGLDLSDSFVVRDASYSDTIYLGVLANTPRREEVVSYLTYLYS